MSLKPVRTSYVPVRKRLGELLIDAGVIDETQLQFVLAHQRKWGGRLGQCIVDLQIASEGQVVRALASKFDCAIVDVGALERGPGLEAALSFVPREVALGQKILALSVDKSSLSVAMADPTNFVATDELSFRTGRRVRVAIAGERDLEAALKRFYGGEDPARPSPPPISAGATAPAAGPSSSSPSPPPPAEASPSMARQAAVLEALTEAGRGNPSPLFEPGRLAAATARLMLRKGLVSDAELLDELARK